MNITWTPEGWEDYLYWQGNDTDKVEKINGFIKECKSNPFKGTGKPEPLKGNLSGYWSRRINHEHRFIYKVAGDQLTIIQCRFHY